MSVYPSNSLLKVLPMVHVPALLKGTFILVMEEDVMIFDGIHSE
ncbi:MAG: hypothetical protein ACTSUE_24465 [Promethearchaeota archaeon]